MTKTQKVNTHKMSMNKRNYPPGSFRVKYKNTYNTGRIPLSAKLSKINMSKALKNFYKKHRKTNRFHLNHGSYNDMKESSKGSNNEVVTQQEMEIKRRIEEKGKELESLLETKRNMDHILLQKREQLDQLKTKSSQRSFLSHFFGSSFQIDIQSLQAEIDVILVEEEKINKKIKNKEDDIKLLSTDIGNR